MFGKHAGIVCGSYRRSGGGDEHRLCVLQRLQPETAQGPALLALHRRLHHLPHRCRALQCLPVTGAIVAFGDMSNDYQECFYLKNSRFSIILRTSI